VCAVFKEERVSASSSTQKHCNGISGYRKEGEKTWLGRGQNAQDTKIWLEDD